ncbi:MAG: hypothetical protein RL716_134 [Actinomycetota bacterium]
MNCEPRNLISQSETSSINAKAYLAVFVAQIFRLKSWLVANFIFAQAVKNNQVKFMDDAPAGLCFAGILRIGAGDGNRTRTISLED